MRQNDKNALPATLPHKGNSALISELITDGIRVGLVALKIVCGGAYLMKGGDAL